MLIRQESNKDYDDVYNLIQAAFATAEHSDGNEQDLVAALRCGTVFIKELSLVAEINGQIAGHIMFTKAKVGSSDVIVLAPLSVHPEFQKHGIGSTLINEGHKIAKELGYPYSLVLGSEKYYPRFGYLPAEQFGIIVPEGIPSVNFMALKLQEDAQPISGSVTCAKEFGVTQSMSRKGNCLDNAPIESFFGHMKDELDLKSCRSFEEVKEMVENYIYYYNNERYQWNLNKMTPVQYRRHLLNTSS